MKFTKAQQMEWVTAKAPGVERAVFHDYPEGGRTYLVRIAAGKNTGVHRHQASEEILVLEGAVEIGGVVLQKGDFVYTEAGEAHNVLALEDAVILVSTRKPIEFL